MPTRSNERLCELAQAGDTAARDILLENNLGFIRKIALEQYRSMGLDENDIGIDLDDLVQEGSIGLLNAIPLFDAGRGMKFLTYAAPAVRNAMTDCIRAALALFEQRMVDKKDGPGFQRGYLDDVLSEDERMVYRFRAACTDRPSSSISKFVRSGVLTSPSRKSVETSNTFAMRSKCSVLILSVLPLTNRLMALSVLPMRVASCAWVILCSFISSCIRCRILPGR